MIVYTVPPCEKPWLLYRGYEGQSLAEMELIWTDPGYPVFGPDVAVFLEDFLYRNFNLVLESDWQFEIEDWWAYANEVVADSEEPVVTRRYVYRSVTSPTARVTTAYLVDRCTGSNIIGIIRKATILPLPDDVFVDAMLREGNGYRAGGWRELRSQALQKSRIAYGEHLNDMA